LKTACGRRWAEPVTRSLAIALVVLLLGGCAIEPPRAWERDLLSRPAMTMDPDPLERRVLDNIYTSRENSFGGDGVGGGGCGCN
jgi:hypothetical protein